MEQKTLDEENSSEDGDGWDDLELSEYSGFMIDERRRRYVYDMSFQEVFESGISDKDKHTGRTMTSVNLPWWLEEALFELRGTICQKDTSYNKMIALLTKHGMSILQHHHDSMMRSINDALRESKNGNKVSRKIIGGIYRSMSTLFSRDIGGQHTRGVALIKWTHGAATEIKTVIEVEMNYIFVLSMAYSLRTIPGMPDEIKSEIDKICDEFNNMLGFVFVTVNAWRQYNCVQTTLSIEGTETDG